MPEGPVAAEPRPVLFLCTAAQLDRERLGFARAFARLGVPVETIDGERDGLELRAERPGPPPRLVVWPDTGRVPPMGMTVWDVPTACFHVDAFVEVPRRVTGSMLFDYACLFHTRFVPVWARAGHPRPVWIPHAVDPEPFVPRGETRRYEVGWVGQFQYACYASRQRLLPRLAARFQMNDWRRPHSFDEMAEVQRCSKIVVNINRDDYPEGANLRMFEAMASGALLVTRLPSEATEMGLKPGVHFVGYEADDELLDVVGHYLAHDAERLRIAETGRDAVLRDHTYDRRAAALLATVDADGGRLFAPARHWSAGKTARTYLRCYAETHEWATVQREFHRLTRMSGREAIQALPWTLRELVWQWRLRLRLRERVTRPLRAAAAAIGGFSRWTP